MCSFYLRLQKVKNRYEQEELEERREEFREKQLRLNDGVLHFDY